MEAKQIPDHILIINKTMSGTSKFKAFAEDNFDLS